MRSGSLRTAAAPITGVASRNEKRAASSLDSPARRPPAMAAPEREKPGSSASACAVPMPAAFLTLSSRTIRSSLNAASLRTGAWRRQRSAANSSSPLRNRNAAAASGEAKTLRSGCSSASPSSPAGTVPMTSSQPSHASASSTPISRSRSATQAADDPHPVVPEEPEQHERRGQVGGDEEREEEVVGLVDVPAQQPWRDHAVPQAGHREQLGGALQQAQHDRLGVGDRV